mmetsp:Transcript_20607/g.26060  ORF Transcript_20607/g.26060 Transcript_20607/m.26060 type:complete len:83 (-) Transcript_20607:273-521(-)
MKSMGQRCYFTITTQLIIPWRYHLIISFALHEQLFSSCFARIIDELDENPELDNAEVPPYWDINGEVTSTQKAVLQAKSKRE